MKAANLKRGQKYTRAELYDLLGVPEVKRAGDWNTGYTRYEDAFYIFATVGVPGRTGHDYSNYWKDDRTRLVWEAKSTSHVGQPHVQALVSGQFPVHLFTRSDDRPAFGYEGLVIAESVSRHSTCWRHLEPGDEGVTLKVDGPYDRPCRTPRLSWSLHGPATRHPRP